MKKCEMCKKTEEQKKGRFANEDLCDDCTEKVYGGESCWSVDN